MRFASSFPVFLLVSFAWRRLPVTAVSIAMGAGVPACTAHAQSPSTPAIAWKTDRQFEAQLAAPLPNLVLSESPLEPALRRLAETNEVLIVLDRRVDPGRQLDFSSRGEPLEETLRRLAAELQLGVAVVGSAVYVGPTATAALLETWAEVKQEELKRLPSAVRTAMARRRSTSWPLLTTPRQALEQVAAELGMRWESLEAVPHDLMRAAAWPPMSAPHRLSLLLAGFDLTYEVEGELLRLARLPETAQLTRTYTVTAAQLDAVQRWARQEGVELAVARTRVRLTGSGHQHRRLQAILDDDPRRTTTVGEVKTGYTLKVENQPLGPVARELARQMGLTVEFSDGVTEKQLRTQVSFDVKLVSREQLLDALLAPADLRGDVTGERLTIRPR